MKIYIQNLTGNGQNYEFDVKASTTVQQLKDNLYEQAGNSVRSIRNMLIHFDKDILDENDATLSSYGIEDGSQLQLDDPTMQGRNPDIFGVSFGVRFVDVSNDSGLRRQSWSKDAPRWRRSRCGLCLEGPCSNSDCDAFEKMVVIPIGYTKFDILIDPSEDNCVCPLCKTFVHPKTCGLNNCWWRFYGKKQSKIDNKPPQNCSSDWRQADDAYHRFDESESGSVVWRQLVLEVFKRKTV